MARMPNKRSFLGDGYYPCHIPTIIKELVLHDPGWYTPYTAYQAEAAQGRLELLWHYQRIVANLMGLPIANASMLDDEHACGEAIMMAYAAWLKNQNVAHAAWLKSHHDNMASRNNIRVGVHRGVSPRIFKALKWRLPMEIVEFETEEPEQVFCCLYQMPSYGMIPTKTTCIRVAICDPLYAALWAPPGQLGMDIACGSMQRLGLPMGYGGPTPGFLACKAEYLRLLPGRIVGLSRDLQGNPAYRLAL